MRKQRPSPEREKELRRRQDPPKWGKEYLPGQLATREEAPDYSRPSSVVSLLLNRTVHLMSEPELYCFLLADWLGVFFDLHEGRMLHPEPAPGFFVGCPGLSQLAVARHQGSILAAERLGLLAFHPTIRTETGTIGYPMLCDQLYFGRDEEGVYAVNWCIKNEPNDFEKAFEERDHGRKKKSDEHHQGRLLIEAEVFREAGIRTIHASKADIPRHLRENLRALYPHQFRNCSLEKNLRTDFVNEVSERLPRQVPVNETIASMIRRHGGTHYDYRVAFYQGVWRKKIRCDLLRPLLVDCPLYPSGRNIEALFNHWTVRGEV